MTKDANVLKSENLIYYCNNNNTTKYSTNGKKHSICKCDIKLNKFDNKFYLYNGHSHQCLSISEQTVEIYRKLMKKSKIIMIIKTF